MKNNKKNKSLFPIANKLAQLTTMSNTILSRRSLAGYLGQSFGGDRDLYTECGYPVELRYDNFYSRFVRQDISQRILAAYPDATWRMLPEVYETEDSKETEFERMWKDMVKKKKIFHYLKRTDKISGIGQYAVLLLGFADGVDFKTELKEGEGKQLLYMRPYSQSNASIYEWETNQRNERYGLPKVYDLTVNNPINLSSSNDNKSDAYSHIYVHWTRIIHIAQDLQEDDVYGTPVLESIYNRLQDIETILGGSTEMFWKMGFPGLALKAESDSNWDIQTKADMESQVKNYMNGLERVMRLRGIDVQQLIPTGIDPTPLLSMELKFISGAKGIPLRVLIGSERGELASTQDDKNWNSRVAERREYIGEHSLIRPFVERLQYAGILPNVEFNIDWPDINVPSDIERADVGLKRMQALQLYCNAIGADDRYPIEKFLENEMGMNPEEIALIMPEYEKAIAEEEKQALLEQEIMKKNQNQDQKAI